MKNIKCVTPNCRRKPVLGMLGRLPCCRKCGDERNRKSRERSAKARASGHYSPSIMARWSDAKVQRMGMEVIKQLAKEMP